LLVVNDSRLELPTQLRTIKEN